MKLGLSVTPKDYYDKNDAVHNVKKLMIAIVWSQFLQSRTLAYLQVKNLSDLNDFNVYVPCFLAISKLHCTICQLPNCVPNFETACIPSMQFRNRINYVFNAS